ncbi:hypothetical protein [Bacillus sp. JCM 19041]
MIDLLKRWVSFIFGNKDVFYQETMQRVERTEVSYYQECRCR